MNRIELFAKAAAVVLVATSLTQTAPIGLHPVGTADAACKVATQRAVAEYDILVLVIAFCDHAIATDAPKGFFVLALHSSRECDGVCSTNMGWFAVRKSTGQLYDWDTAQWVLGREI